MLTKHPRSNSKHSNIPLDCKKKTQKGLGLGIKMQQRKNMKLGQPRHESNSILSFIIFPTLNCRSKRKVLQGEKLLAKHLND
jgi:hypothetical protein